MNIIRKVFTTFVSTTKQRKEVNMPFTQKDIKKFAIAYHKFAMSEHTTSYSLLEEVYSSIEELRYYGPYDGRKSMSSDFRALGLDLKKAKSQAKMKTKDGEESTSEQNCKKR